MATTKSFCRICHGFCGVEADVENGRLVRIRPDPTDPVSHGFICSKGLLAPDQLHGEGRLRGTLRRDGSGAFQPIGAEEALDQVGAKLKQLRDDFGPDSIAVYAGTQNLFDAVNPIVTRAFAESVAGGNLFATMTIDQSAKWIAEARAGTFGGGPQSFADADVWMMVGSNPLVTLVAGAGPAQFGFHDPVRAMKRAKARGLKLIVIDPRLSDTARYADLFLQPIPGEDATLLAGILHVVLREGWHDKVFSGQVLTSLAPLEQALAPFTPERVSATVGVPSEDIIAAAAMFARDSRRGMVGSGTGPDMGPDSNLAEHLVHALNLVCGRFLREGETVRNPGVLGPRVPRVARPVASVREWESGPMSRHHGLGRIRGQMMSAKLPDEILSQGEDRIRALICVGGNPAVALPDQRKTVSALGALELLVTIDPRMSATAKLAHYVFAPLLHYEKADQTSLLESFFSMPFAHVTPPIVEPSPDDDLVDDWYVFWRLARHLGTPLRLGGLEIPVETRPERSDLLALLAAASQVPYEAVRSHDGGRIFSVPPQTVEGGSWRDDEKLNLLPPDVADELRDLGQRGRSSLAAPGDAALPFRLIVRRLRGVMNSTLADAAAVRSKTPDNPVFIHPDDMAALGLRAGQRVAVAATHARLTAVVEPDDSLRRGAVCMTHCWGDAEAGEQASPFRELATNRLVDPSLGEQSINAMPIMTGIPVAILRLEPAPHPRP